MVRLYRVEKINHVSKRKHKKPSPKTGPLKDKLALGFKAHANAVGGELASLAFIPKVKNK